MKINSTCKELDACIFPLDPRSQCLRSKSRQNNPFDTSLKFYLYFFDHTTFPYFTASLIYYLNSIEFKFRGNGMI
jgi:hypothetical protein